MARVPIYIEVKDSAGNVVPAASVTVKSRATAINSTLYNAEVAGSVISNPTIADSLGRVGVWADPDNFVLTVSGTGITTYTVNLDGTGIPPDNSITAAKVVDDSITADDLFDAPKLGLTDTAAVRRGFVTDASVRTLTGITTYTVMPTAPDRVASVAIAAGTLLIVAFQALWTSTVATSAQAAIFIGGTQLKYRPGSNPGGAPVVQQAQTTGDVNEYEGLASYQNGLVTSGSAAGVDSTSDVTTGMALGVNATGGVCYIHSLTPGTYDVEIRFKATSGNVSRKESKLWVWTSGF